MKISNIDKDFEDIIPYVDKKGLKPFASCDGVIKNHPKGADVTKAYVAFMQSNEIANVMAAFYKDPEVFTLNMDTQKQKDPKYLYGNVITGNEFMIYFNNLFGEKTEYFKKIIRGVLEHTITIDKASISTIKDIIKAMEEAERKVGNNEEQSELCYSIELNGSYHSIDLEPARDGHEKINSVQVSGKYSALHYINMQKAAKKISEIFDIPFYIDGIGREEIHEEEFVQMFLTGSEMHVYLNNDKLQMIPDVIRQVHLMENELEIVEKMELPPEFFDTPDEYQYYIIERRMEEYENRVSAGLEYDIEDYPDTDEILDFERVPDGHDEV